MFWIMGSPNQIAIDSAIIEREIDTACSYKIHPHQHEIKLNEFIFLGN